MPLRSPLFPVLLLLLTAVGLLMHHTLPATASMPTRMVVSDAVRHSGMNADLGPTTAGPRAGATFSTARQCNPGTVAGQCTEHETCIGFPVRCLPLAPPQLASSPGFAAVPASLGAAGGHLFPRSGVPPPDLSLLSVSRT